MASFLQAAIETQDTFTLLLGTVAAISLLVGGIGVMNIMLVSVVERTREIGIRRAIGARQNDIVRQFMTEAVLISIMGGLLGIVFGYTLSKIIATSAGWSTDVTPESIGIAFGVSVFIGLLFGIYPAVQAAKLDPIEAIRYE
jgi:putative ABC transport system permease protein